MNGGFDGRKGFVDIPNGDALALGVADFTIALWLRVSERADAGGDIVSKWDLGERRGVTLTLSASAGGYNSNGTEQVLHFGTDSGTEPVLRYCGHPNRGSNFTNSLTVFAGQLFVATTDAHDEHARAHVYRYVGGETWEDCGRVGVLKGHGVGPLVVHEGSLYAATWNHDWTRVYEEDLDACRVYRYLGGTRWEDCGQPGDARRYVSLASYRGRLYVVADDGGAYALSAERPGWERVGTFPRYAHPMAVHNDRLYFGLSTPGHVMSFDGNAWGYHGNPAAADDHCTQIHSLEVFSGRLHATTWPYGRVVRLDDEVTNWVDCGRPGDSTEINALAVYNGCFYAGTIPRAGLFRYDGLNQWDPIKDFHAPPGWEPSSALLDRTHDDYFRLREWARLTSLTTHRGELFASIGSCTGSILDAPVDVRGSVYAMKAGESISTESGLSPGWHHVVATRQRGVLRLMVDGRVVAQGQPGTPALDLRNTSSLQIGRGPADYFPGGIRDVRLYERAISMTDARALGHAVPGSEPALASDRAS